MTTCTSTNTFQKGGKRIIHKVSIKNGKGYKSVTKYNGGKKTSFVKKPIHESHVKLIRSRKFIPGLFSDCRGKKCKNKTRKKK